MKSKSLSCLSCIVLAFVVPGCVAYNNESSNYAADDCGAPFGWEEIAERAEGKVLFFGETHGTKETPSAFVRYVCAVSSLGGRTLVALEISTTHNEAIKAAYVAGDSESFRNTLLAKMDRHWRSTDGRGSVAMLDMMTELYAIGSHSKRSIEVAPVQGFGRLPQFANEAALEIWFENADPTDIQQLVENGMAERLEAQMPNFDRVIMLVGSIHASQAAWEDLPKITPAAALVEDSLSILVADAGGFSWNMRNGESGMIYPDEPTELPEALRSLHRDSMGWTPALAPKFDGYLFIGPVSASPPAIQE